MAAGISRHSHLTSLSLRGCERLTTIEPLAPLYLRFLDVNWLLSFIFVFVFRHACVQMFGSKYVCGRVRALAYGPVHGRVHGRACKHADCTHADWFKCWRYVATASKLWRM